MTQIKGKKILVAGGTGFIGKRLVSRLINEGADVFVITRKEKTSQDRLTYHKADLNDFNSLNSIPKISYDACVYMAANIPEVGQPKETYLDAKRSTLDPLVNFCEVFSSQVSKFVYISTIDVLGGCDELDYDESAPINIATPYGLAKFCGEFYVKDYCSNYSIPYTILRFSQVYGPNEPIVRVIPIIRNAIKYGKEFTIYSDGSELRRFLYVDDAATAIICALNAEEQGIFNIAGFEICSLIDLVDKVEKAYSCKLNLKILNKNKGNSNVPSIGKAELRLGYHPEFSITNGLNAIIEEERVSE